MIGNSEIVAKETLRIEAFSDGVFAIAITLLILDIHVPEFKTNATLFQTLSKDWPSYLAFLIGFFTILICWINHHYMFQMIHRSNSVLALINGFKLLVVTTTPFATALMAKHLQTDWAPSAINIYGFNFAMMGVAMMGIWCYAYIKQFTNSGSAKTLHAITRYYIFAAVFSITIWIVSYINIPACLVLFGLMFLIFIFPEKVIKLQTRQLE